MLLRRSISVSEQIKGDIENLRRAPPAREAPQEIVSLAAGLSGHKVIDVGGGTGTYSSALMSKGFYCLVVDVELSYLEEAKSKGVDTVRMDARHLAIREKSFDTVLLVEVIEHVGDVLSVLKEASRVSSCNVIITTPSHDSYFWLKSRELYVEAALPPSHVDFFTKPSLEKVLARVFESYRVLYGEPIRLFPFTTPLAFKRLYAECSVSPKVPVKLSPNDDLQENYEEPSGLFDFFRLPVDSKSSRFATMALSTLLGIYKSRQDLRSAYPEVRKGDYTKLLDWANKVVSGEIPDSARDVIVSFDVFAMQRILDQLNLQLRTRSGEFETEKQLLMQRLDQVRTELEVIRGSFTYRTVRRLVSTLQRVMPDGTRRGELRRISTAMTQVARREGFRSLLVKIWLKIKRREFGLARPVASPELVISAGAIYPTWLEMTRLTEEDIARIRQEIASLSYKPRISIVTPVYNTDPRWLRKCLGSVLDQVYTEWELCIADDASDGVEVMFMLDEHAAKDKRIKVKHLDQHLGIAGASNAALSLATGDFVAFLDHDDEISPEALYEVARLLNTNPELDFIYSDEDRIDERGMRSEPFFKPDWSPELLMSYNYVPHLSVFRRSIMQEIGGFRLGYDGSQDYDLVLRFTERTERIGHLPKVLYSWRKAKGSAASSTNAKPYAYKAAIKALQEASKRRGFDAEVKEIGPGGRYRVRHRLKERPIVSILIPTKNSSLLEKCLRSLMRSTYPNLEVLVLDSSDGERVREVAAKFKNCRVLRSPDSAPFNYSKVNNWAAQMATGEYILFLNDDTEVIEPSWIEALLEHAQRPGVGAVGAKLVYPSGYVQHAGVILGLRGPAEHYAGIRADDPGYYDLAAVVRNCAAVTAACMMVKKKLFIDQGMFDESLGRAWQDVDFCLRLGQSGYRTVYTPFARLQHRHGATRGIGDKSADEDQARELFLSRWHPLIERGDPYYNPNLSRDTPYELGVHMPDQPEKRLDDPLRLLLAVYHSRKDLQTAYPEAARGDYIRLLEWALSSGAAHDSAKPLLSRYAEWYGTHLREVVLDKNLMRPNTLGERPSNGSVQLPIAEYEELTVSTSNQPLVSIIIVTFNRLNYTRNCLLALSRSTRTYVPFEVIVLDNSSTDGTPSFLKEKVHGVRVVLNDNNRGFGPACNQGARLSKGRYLLFLNNDTEMRPEALQVLVDTIERDSRIGAVGGKLIYPGGLLQEAGSILWRDGTGYALGRGDIPDKSLYSYVRDADYCSASCLLVRSSLFAEIGGFDEQYAPAYYEDTDLCMALRRKGYRILYQPEAEVIHHEYGSSAKDQAIRLMEEHRKIFAAKWKDELSNFPEPEPGSLMMVLKAADRQPGSWILVIDERVAGLEGAGYTRMYQVLTLLKSGGHRITYMPVEHEAWTPYVRRLRQVGIDVFTGSVADQLKFLEEVGHLVEFVVLSRPGVYRAYADIVRKHCPQARVCFDSEALWFMRSMRQASHISDPQRRSQILQRAVEEFATEQKAFLESDLILAVSDSDKKEITRFLPDARVEVIPNIHTIEADVSPPEKRSHLLLVAGFLAGEASPSSDAVHFFTERIWPIIGRRLTDAKLLIVGAYPPASVRKLQSKRIVVTGKVTDQELANYYRSCKVACIPLRFGAGLKQKVTESMAYGLPIVTTPVGAEGSGLVDGESAFITDEPTVFAERVVQLYQNADLWREFSRSSQEIARERFSDAAVSARLEEIFAIRQPENAGLSLYA